MTARDPTRRAFLRVAAVASAGGLAGCLLLEESEPPGTLVVRNDHDRTHRIAVRVRRAESPSSVDVGREWTNEVAAGEEVTIERWLTGSANYRIEMELDRGETEVVEFQPLRYDADPSGRVLAVVVDEEGRLVWVIESVEITE